MANLDFFGQKMFTMNGFTQIAPPISGGPMVRGPIPYGIWPVSFTPEALAEARAAAEARARGIGQAVVPAAVPVAVDKADLFGIILGLGALGAGVYSAVQPGPHTAKRYLAPAAAAVAGFGLLVKSF
jgi:hypothetical protein